MDIIAILSYVNIINIIFFILTLGVVVPEFILSRYTPYYDIFSSYGKLHKVIPYQKYFEVPKRYFHHFYILAGSLALFTCIIFLRSAIFNLEPYTGLNSVIILLTSEYNSVGFVESFLGIFLLSGHVMKRLYESTHIQVYSSAKMNVFAYFVGLFHYLGLFLTIASHSYPFASSAVTYAGEDLSSVHFSNLIWVLIIVFASYGQFDSLSRLANLRKNNKEKNKYFLPEGGLFNVVSNPHMLCEIVVYIGIWGATSYRNTSWLYVLLWVIINQVCMAIKNHNWYKLTFKYYPSIRKAIIPFLL